MQDVSRRFSPDVSPTKSIALAKRTRLNLKIKHLNDIHPIRDNNIDYKVDRCVRVIFEVRSFGHPARTTSAIHQNHRNNWYIPEKEMNGR